MRSKTRTKNRVEPEPPAQQGELFNAIYEAIIEGRTISTLDILPPDLTENNFNVLKAQAKNRINQEARVEALEMRDRQVIRLQRVFGEARRVGDFYNAVAALKELNVLLNLYEHAADNDKPGDDLAAQTDAELDLLYQVEIEKELARRGRSTIQ